MTFSLALVVQLVIASAVGAGLIAACRWLRRRSTLCAQIVIAGLLLRAVVTLFLFWTSYLDLPFLRHMHSGDGFWSLAVDARIYYDSAFRAADQGLETVARGSQSPAFVKALALWMRAVGSSPISGAYLNLALYVALCLMAVAAFRPSGRWRSDLPCAVMLAALSFSPVLVVYSSQPLKDMMFVFLIGTLCVAAHEFLPPLTTGSEASRESIARGLLLSAIFLAALYLVAGMRAYYAVIVWTALAVVMFLFAWPQRFARLLRYVPVCVLLLTAGWWVYMSGADLDYVNPFGTFVPYRKVVNAAKSFVTPARAAAKTPPPPAPEAPPSVLTKIDGYRAGFVLTPGATSTNAKKASAPGPAAPTASPAPAATPAATAAPAPHVEVSGPPGTPGALVPTGGMKGRLTALAVGLALFFVPVSLLKALSIVDFTGGRGLLTITDVDTLFMDVTIVAALACLVRRRPVARGLLPYACFAAIVASAAGLLMAYIVTNFGTLFRLRLMAVAPLWMLPLALGARLREQPDDATADLAARTRASFGYEWTHFNRWQDSGEISFRDSFETADLTALAGACVLDAGCGMGRHARQVAAHARHVVAVDFSRAIEQAAMNTREVGNVDCVQADLLRLPFPDATFDYVYSLGVLHHLGNTEDGVRALVATLKPGGRLRVYLYWKRHGPVGAVLRLVNAVRPLTTRLPFWLLRWFCWMLSAVLWLAVILPYRLLRALGVRGMDTWPLFVYARYPFRVLYNDQFDRFSAPLEKRYDPEEVSALLESAGLREVRVESRFGWIAEGVKPAPESVCAG
jgi:SAM-dependent methyltransferase